MEKKSSINGIENSKVSNQNQNDREESEFETDNDNDNEEAPIILYEENIKKRPAESQNPSSTSTKNQTNQTNQTRKSTPKNQSSQTNTPDNSATSDSSTPGSPYANDYISQKKVSRKRVKSRPALTNQTTMANNQNDREDDIALVDDIENNAKKRSMEKGLKKESKKKPKTNQQDATNDRMNNNHQQQQQPNQFSQDISSMPIELMEKEVETAIAYDRQLSDLELEWDLPNDSSEWKQWSCDRFGLFILDEEKIMMRHGNGEAKRITFEDVQKLYVNYKARILRLSNVILNRSKLIPRYREATEAEAVQKVLERLSNVTKKLGWANDYLVSDVQMSVLKEKRSDTVCPVSSIRKAYQIITEMYQMLTPREIVYLFVLDYIEGRNYRKKTDKYCKEILNGKGQGTRAWKSQGTIEDLVRDITSHHCNPVAFHNIMQVQGQHDCIAKMIEKGRDPEFQRLIQERWIFSFRNGIYVAKDNKFFRYGVDEISSSIVSAKFHDCDFPDHLLHVPVEKIDCQDFEKILKDQEIPEDAIRDSWIFWGRFIFPNAFDSWEKIIWIVGKAGTGKSTIARIIQRIYDLEDTSSMSSSGEEVFGLWQHMDKFITVVYEMAEKMSLKREQFQSMVSATEEERTTVSIKNEKAVNIVWKTQMLWLGNTYPKWNDEQGNLRRRIYVLPFTKVLTNIDTKLVERFIAKNMGFFILKAARSFLEAFKNFGHTGMDSFLSSFFKNKADEMRSQLDPFVSFLQDTSIVEINPQRYTQKKTFILEFAQYAKSIGKPHVVSAAHMESVFEEMSIHEHHAKANWNRLDEVLISNYYVGVGMVDPAIAGDIINNQQGCITKIPQVEKAGQRPILNYNRPKLSVLPPLFSDNNNGNGNGGDDDDIAEFDDDDSKPNQASNPLFANPYQEKKAQNTDFVPVGIM